MVVGVVLEKRAVNLVSAAAGLDVDRGAARKSLLGVKTVRDDIDFLDRFQRRYVRRDVRQLDVVRTHAVDARIVLVVARPVDVEFQRP